MRSSDRLALESLPARHAASLHRSMGCVGGVRVLLSIWVPSCMEGSVCLREAIHVRYVLRIAFFSCSSLFFRFQCESVDCVALLVVDIEGQIWFAPGPRPNYPKPSHVLVLQTSPPNPPLSSPCSPDPLGSSPRYCFLQSSPLHRPPPNSPPVAPPS